jgi:trehalose/maltose hydrolase-like predicted phosphorylase
MGGTWMSVVYGFGGMRIREGLLSFDPMLPLKWKELSFKILYRGRTVRIQINRKRVHLENLDGEGIALFLYGVKKQLEPGGELVAEVTK